MASVPTPIVLASPPGTALFVALFQALAARHPMEDWDVLYDRANALALLATAYRIDGARVLEEWLPSARELTLAEFDRWAQPTRPIVPRWCPNCSRDWAQPIGDRYFCATCAQEIS